MADSSRVAMHDGPDGLNISIAARLNPYFIVMAVVLIAINLGIVYSELRNTDTSIILICVAVLFLFLSVRTILWNIRGSEEISVDSQHLKIRFDTLGTGKTQTFNVSDVDTLRTFVPRGKQRIGQLLMFPDQRGVIVFDY